VLTDTACSVVELRQYTLQPGTVPAFVTLFEREFVDTQEAVGMHLLGTFTDLDAADRFVWLRGFADMATRHAGLTAFYNGPCWQAHRDEANGMMIDSDNVRLLRPVASSPRLEYAAGAERDGHTSRRSVTVVVQPVRQRRDVAHEHGAGIDDIRGVLGVYETADLVNDFPQLPVIEGEHVLVLVLEPLGRTEAEVLAAAVALAEGSGATVDGPATVLRLAPTPRSRLG
jgi:hypothetical protein